MSSYSYMILPCVAPSSVFATCSLSAPSNFGADKGFVLGTWILYIACAGQREAAPLGYSPLPPNLVQDDFDAVNRLPGHPTPPPLDYQHCPNPTLYTGSSATASASASASATSSASASASAAASQDVASAIGGDTNVDPNSLQNATVLPPGFTRVTVLDSAARRQQLDAALAAAQQAQSPSRAPLWIATLVVLVGVFTPMLLATVRRRRRRG
jgi:phosphate transport system substrate-binding protein